MLDAGADARQEHRGAPGAQVAPVGAAEAEAVSMLVFRAGGALFAVPAEQVEQVQRLRRPGAAEFSLAQELGRLERGQTVVTLRAAGARVRLRAEEVLQVASLPLEAIYALPPLAAQRQGGGYVIGVGVLGERLVVLLDVAALARRADVARSGEAGTTHAA